MAHNRERVVVELQQLQSELDGLRRRYREKEEKEATLSKLFEKEKHRSDGLSQELASARRVSTSCQSELDRLQREVVGLRQVRESAVQSMEESKAYAKKLEAKLVGGERGHFLLEQNNKLRGSLEEAKRRGEVSPPAGPYLTLSQPRHTRLPRITFFTPFL